MIAALLCCLGVLGCRATAAPADRLLGTAAGKLIAIEVRDGNQVAVTEVGATGAMGCASLAQAANGDLYSVCGPGILKPDQPQQLATIDRKTGKASPFGKEVTGLQVMALEFAPDGTLYAVGDANPASPTYNSLYTVDVKTGEFTRVGSTGVADPKEFFMDFAFDSKGTMFGASSHGLFSIDRKTGTANKVVDFVGGGDVMGLSYSPEGKLYATEFKAPNSAVFVVDTQKGFLTPIAATGLPFAHGLVTVSR
jgi:hypothetical protein